MRLRLSAAGTQPGMGDLIAAPDFLHTPHQIDYEMLGLTLAPLAVSRPAVRRGSALEHAYRPEDAP